MDELLIVKNIQKTYGKRHILKDASFTANKGDCIAVVGANGSGKSTLLSAISGTLQYDSGTITIDGMNAENNRAILNKVIGYIPQENPLIEDLSVLDNLRLWYSLSAREMKSKLNNGVFQMLGLKDFAHMTVSKLSGGQKKRTSIAIAVANNPSILILDEPSAALDLVCKINIRNYLRDFQKQGGTIIITTHDEDELDLCNKLYVMSDGILTERSASMRGDNLLKYMQ